MTEIWECIKTMLVISWIFVFPLLVLLWNTGKDQRRKLNAEDYIVMFLFITWFVSIFGMIALTRGR